MSGAHLHRAAFVQIPLELLIASAERKGTVFVYGWLWHHAGRDDTAFPSIDTLASECRMKADDVRQALRYLVDQGWVTRHDRPGRTALFRVRMEALRPPDPPPAAATKPSQPTPPPNGGPHPSPKWGRRTRTKEQEPRNKRNPPPNPRYARVRPPWGLHAHQANRTISPVQDSTASSRWPRAIALAIPR